MRIDAAITFNRSGDILLRITFKGTVTFWALFYRQVYHSLKEKRKLASVFLDELQHAEYGPRELKARKWSRRLGFDPKTDCVKTQG